MMYLMVKHSHITFVVITLLLFNIRFWLRYLRPERPLPVLLRVLPHINDTLLLFTGLWVMTITHFTPFGNANWLGVKLILVVLYILCGFKALKMPPRSGKSNLAYAVGMLCACGIVYLAYYKPF